MRANGTTDVAITPYTEDHLEPAVEALLRVRIADPTYPPPHDAPATTEAFTEWLLSEEVIGRWVAIVDGLPSGHISLTHPHGYLTNALADLGFEATAENGFCEISKFFTDPLYQGLGVGAALFEAAIAAGRELGFQPALAVIDTSYAARRFYAAKGLREVGSFEGIHGTNYVFAAEG